MNKTASKTTQECRLCHEVKPLDLFEIDRRVKDGVTSRCKACKAGLNDRARSLFSRLKLRAHNGRQPLEVTLKEIQALFAAFDGKCIYCNIDEKDSKRRHHVDHLVSVSKGGRHHRSNLVLACASCNSSKGSEPFFSFYIRKKREISDDSFNTLMYYVAFMSGQPVADVITSFILEYKKDAYSHLSDLVGDDDMRGLIHDAVTTKMKVEAS